VKRIIDLTLRMVDGTATDGETRELERLTEGDRHARNLHVEMLEIEAALRAGAREEDEAECALTEARTVHAVMQGVQRSSLVPARPRFAARPIWAALALVGVAASLAIVAWPSAGARRRAGSAGPFAFGRSRTPLEAAVVSHTGWAPAPMRIRGTGIDGVSRLESEDLAIEVRGGVVRAIERDASGARRVLVDEGAVLIESTGQAAPAPLVLVTPHAQVIARSRRAVLSVSGDQTRFDLHDGTATVRRLSDQRTVELVARQTISVDDDAALAAAPLPAALFIQGHLWGRHPTELLDEALVRRLETMGFLVDAVDELELGASHLAEKSLVLISPSVSQAMLGKIDELSLASLEIPVICSRPSLFPALAMTATDSGFASNATRLQILVPEHPLAAGLSGPLQVTRGPGPLGWGQPGPDAIRVASFPDARKSDRAAVFAYERGASMMAGARAPARRVGFFLHPDLAPYVTEAGWALLAASVRWAAGDERP
jgi:hypothetical protein